MNYSNLGNELSSTVEQLSLWFYFKEFLLPIIFLLFMIITVIYLNSINSKFRKNNDDFISNKTDKGNLVSYFHTFSFVIIIVVGSIFLLYLLFFLFCY